MSTVVQSTRFQNVQIQPENVFSFPQGLIGFEMHREFVLIDKAKKKRFQWLQSLRHPDLCFLLIDPDQVVESFKPRLSQEEQSFLQARNGDSLTFLCLVSVDEAHENISVNLRSPIVINFARRLGRQVILEDETLPVRFLLT